MHQCYRNAKWKKKCLLLAMGYLRSTRRHLEEMAFMLNFSDDLVRKKKKILHRAKDRKGILSVHFYKSKNHKNKMANVRANTFLRQLTK